MLTSSLAGAIASGVIKMGFLIHSPVLEKLQPRFQQVVQHIRQAIASKRPILIRHHADADGYTAAIALEKAILPLLYEVHTRERDTFYYYTRLPSLTPFYDYSDATRDITNFLGDITRFEHKAPLIIILDTGSSQQDLLSLKKVKLYNAQVIVIDHHPPCPEVATIVDIHVNPHHVGSTYDFSAGMLCAEIAAMINPSLPLLASIASVSGVADKVQSNELKQYITLAHTDGNSGDFIKQVAECLDFEAYTLRSFESRELIHDLLGNDRELQKKLVALIQEEIKKHIALQMQSLLKYAVVEEKKHVVIARVNIDEVKHNGDFPPRGKCTGLLHDQLKQRFTKPVLTLGMNATGINFRCSTELTTFDVNVLIKTLQEQLPYAQVEGGGHRVAGSLTFISAARTEVLQRIDHYINTL